jgi:hypothetical protein
LPAFASPVTDFGGCGTFPTIVTGVGVVTFPLGDPQPASSAASRANGTRRRTAREFIGSA